jgi:hypothetical protein
MLSIFACPKPFRGHIGIIQRNAIGSWKQLQPPCEIFLFGDEEGTAVAAKELGVSHVPDVARNEFGTPFLNDVFKKGEQLATYPIHCYVNSDIILGRGFMLAITKLTQWRRRFLMVGECWNLDVTEAVPFNNPTWEQNLNVAVSQRGKLRGIGAIDYFVFPRGLYHEIPAFVLGRAAFDNWLIWRARNLKAPVVDATQVVTAIHQNHDYFHIAGGSYSTLHGQEAMSNLQLAGGMRHCYHISDATHKLLSTGIRWNWRGDLRVEVRTKPMKEQARRAFWWLVEWTRSVRHPLGLHKQNWRKLQNVLFGEKRFY